MTTNFIGIRFCAAIAASAFVASHTNAQTPDTTPERLPDVVITAKEPAPPVTSLPEVRGTLVYSGKKTELLRVDSLGANTAQNITRQIVARVPGANVSETENSGFPSNGIGFRGLNPVQSVEMNVRQDGVNIVADLYGYPETYYTPPAEAVDRIEFVRGSSSLQFGPQFGGVLNYVMRDGAPNTRPAFHVRQTLGSFGLFNSYFSIDGGSSKWTYYAYGQYRGQQGWRPNSDLSQFSGAARVRYQASDKVRLSFEYSMLRNRIHMAGGLDNEEFDENSQQSFRSRNWLASPWNIASASVDIDLSANTQLTSTVSYMFSQRYLVWRNEDGGAQAPDSIDPVTLQYAPREVEREYFNNITNETRLRTNYHMFGGSHTLATGVRLLTSWMHRQEGGEGTTGTDFDMTVTGPYEKDTHYYNTNVAFFAENVFRLGTRLSVTPGVRVEYLHSMADGYTDTTFVPQSKDRTFPLAGIGAQFHASTSTDVYANITQAYRPIEYSFLTPFASVTRVDPNIKDPKGYNADLGWRGNFGQAVAFDLGVFYLAYNDRIGVVSKVDPDGTPYTERTNVANSVHRGAEAYVELHPFAMLGLPSSMGTLSVFDALAWVHARYTSGDFDGKSVEFAPDVVNRVGVSYALSRFSTTLQWSLVSQQFTDANNTVASYDSNVGIVPEYQLFDWSARCRLSNRLALAAGVNNIANISYFTLRTTEYPGPGIIPGIGRSVYATITAGL